MKRLSVLIGVMALLLLLGQTAHGDIIIDTGFNTPSDPGRNFTQIFNNSQSVAGVFTTYQYWTVGAIEGYIMTKDVGVATVKIYTYGGIGTFPSGTALITENFELQAGAVGWQGPTGLADFLQAGSYWIAFEVPSDSSAYGLVGGADPPPNYTLDPEAYTSNGLWYPFQDTGPNPTDYLYLCVRIESSAVPLPGAVWLLGSGLLGLAGLRRVRRS